MMDLGKEELKEILKYDKVMYKYMEDLENLNKMPEFREYMTYEMDKEIIHNTEIHEATKKGKIEGKKEGLEEGKKITALNMLKEGINIEVIIRCTNLTKEEIELLNN